MLILSAAAGIIIARNIWLAKILGPGAWIPVRSGYLLGRAVGDTVWGVPGAEVFLPLSGPLSLVIAAAMLGLVLGPVPDPVPGVMGSSLFWLASSAPLRRAVLGASLAVLGVLETYRLSACVRLAGRKAEEE